MNPEEQFAPIPGWEGMYAATVSGRIWSHRSGKYLKPYPNPAGYLQIGLARDGKSSSKNVHPLILRAFVGEPEEGQEVRHLNGDSHDNRPENLAWGTKAENMADRIAHGNNPELRKTHCENGHEFTPANTYIRRNGGRCCRSCKRARDRKYRTGDLGLAA